jgi:hypothetical protein
MSLVNDISKLASIYNAEFKQGKRRDKASLSAPSRLSKVARKFELRSFSQQYTFDRDVYDFQRAFNALKKVKDRLASGLDSELDLDMIVEDGKWGPATQKAISDFVKLFKIYYPDPGMNLDVPDKDLKDGVYDTEDELEKLRKLTGSVKKLQEAIEGGLGYQIAPAVVRVDQKPSGAALDPQVDELTRKYEDAPKPKGLELSKEEKLKKAKREFASWKSQNSDYQNAKADFERNSTPQNALKAAEKLYSYISKTYNDRSKNIHNYLMALEVQEWLRKVVRLSGRGSGFQPVESKLYLDLNRVVTELEKSLKADVYLPEIERDPTLI